MNSQDAVSLTRDLLHFDTVNPPGQERDCARWAGALLEAWGYKVDYHEFEEGRTSVIARAGGSDQKAPLCMPWGFRTTRSTDGVDQFSQIGRRKQIHRTLQSLSERVGLFGCHSIGSRHFDLRIQGPLVDLVLAKEFRANTSHRGNAKDIFAFDHSCQPIQNRNAHIGFDPPSNRSKNVIKTSQLTKKYDDMYAIRDIDLDLGQGDLFGFIGPNGAGKTTTMRIIATLLTPTYGEAYVCGYSIYTHPKEIRRLVGYMPDFFGVYDDMTVIEYLDFFAAAYRISPQARRKRCDEMLEVVDLEFKRDAYANTLSRGQTQRLGLARVLLHDPAVLLLDEPLSGLDPRARIEMRALMRRLGSMGKTVIVSSHILPELADVCNKVGIIDSGKMIASDDVASMIRHVRPNMAILIEPAMQNQLETAAKLLSNHELVQSVDIAVPSIKATLKVDAGDYSSLATLLVSNGIAIKRFAEEEINLESAFMAFTKGAGAKI